MARSLPSLLFSSLSFPGSPEEAFAFAFEEAHSSLCRLGADSVLSGTTVATRGDCIVYGRSVETDMSAAWVLRSSLKSS